MKTGYRTDKKLLQVFKCAFKCLPDKVLDVWTKEEIKPILISYEEFSFIAIVVMMDRKDGKEIPAILITDKWMREPTKRRTFILAHETAHIYLHHSNSPSPEIFRVEELEANKLAFEWLGKGYWKVKMYSDKLSWEHTE